MPALKLPETQLDSLWNFLDESWRCVGLWNMLKLRSSNPGLMRYPLWVDKGPPATRFIAEIEMTDSGAIVGASIWSPVSLNEQTDAEFLDFTQSLPLFWDQPTSVNVWNLTADIDAAFRRTLSINATGWTSLTRAYRAEPHCVFYTVAPGVVSELNISLCDEFTLDSLLMSDAAFVNTNWKFGTPESVSWIESIIKYGASSCIRLKNTQELISWVIMGPHGFLTNLRTMPAHQRKGLAKAVVNDLVAKVRNLGATPFAMVEPTNTASLNLFINKLGWKNVDCDTCWSSLAEK